MLRKLTRVGSDSQTDCNPITTIVTLASTPPASQVARPCLSSELLHGDVILANDVVQIIYSFSQLGLGKFVGVKHPARLETELMFRGSGAGWR